mgnify:CR=1 FL=1
MEEDGGCPAPAWMGSLVDQGVEAHVVFAADLSIIYANDEGLAIHGYRGADIAGLDGLSQVHSDALTRAATHRTGGNI